MALMGLLLPLCILFGGFQLNAVHDGRSHLMTEDMQLDEELEILNKLPTKTIKTEEGDVVDCIDIYKQPTLDHPLLKNHRIRMRPTCLPKNIAKKRPWTTKARQLFVKPPFIDCPDGTVPIRRTRKEDLIRARNYEQNSTNSHILTGLTPGKHQAIFRTINNPKIIYKGIQGTFNIYNPVARPGQSSSSQVWIENGARNVHNSLQAGWMVAPGLYSDSQTRSFLYWSVEGNPRRGCFNYLCQGFVQTDKKYGIGLPMNVSNYGSETQIVADLRIAQDPNTGDWWLMNPSHNIYFGYWPKSLVPLLTNGASQVVWGGQVISSSDGASPEMGSGHFPDGHYNHDCYTCKMKVLDTSYYLVDPVGPEYRTESFVDSTKCYSMQGGGYTDDHNEYAIFFGGPGGQDCGI